MNLATLFEFSCNRFPDHFVLVQEKKRFTYGQLNEEADRIASSLKKLGLEQRDRVLVLLKNRPEIFVLFWACQKLGAVFTPLNPHLSPEEIHYCVNDVEARIVVFEETTRHSLLKEKLDVRPILITVDEEGADLTYRDLKDKGTNFENAAVDADDLAVILFTSGTSGLPKGVPRSHKNEYCSTMAHIVQNRYRVFDRMLGAVPLYHTMGLRTMLSAVFLNGTIVAMRDFDAYEALKLIEEEGIQTLFLTPKMYYDMVNDLYCTHFDYRSIRCLGYAGAPMSPELTEKCDKLFQPEHFVNHYGSTEIYTFTVCADIRKKPGCAGTPGIHQQIRLVVPDPDGNSGPSDVVQPGEVGEIIVNAQSPEAFKGYWNRPDATRRAIRNGWYFTGDLGRLDEDHHLYVIGRLDEMIISGGENIYPQEIEKVLIQHPKVAEVAVVGEEDEKWGQIVVAFIVPKKELPTVQELDQFCKSHFRLSSYKRPRKYVFVREIPKNDNGKVLRQKIIAGEVQKIR